MFFKSEKFIQFKMFCSGQVSEKAIFQKGSQRAAINRGGIRWNMNTLCYYRRIWDRITQCNPVIYLLHQEMDDDVLL